MNDKNQETYEGNATIRAIALFRQRPICDKFVTFGFGTARILPLPKANIFQHAPRERKMNDEFHDLLSLASHKKAKNECLAWIILISSGSVGLDFLKWFKNFNTSLLVIS